jgi:hypothetical protein
MTASLGLVALPEIYTISLARFLLQFIKMPSCQYGDDCDPFQRENSHTVRTPPTLCKEKLSFGAERHAKEEKKRAKSDKKKSKFIAVENWKFEEC